MTAKLADVAAMLAESNTQVTTPYGVFQHVDTQIATPLDLGSTYFCAAAELIAYLPAAWIPAPTSDDPNRIVFVTVVDGLEYVAPTEDTVLGETAEKVLEAVTCLLQCSVDMGVIAGGMSNTIDSKNELSFEWLDVSGKPIAEADKAAVSRDSKAMRAIIRTFVSASPEYLDAFMDVMTKGFISGLVARAAVIARNKLTTEESVQAGTVSGGTVVSSALH